MQHPYRLMFAVFFCLITGAFASPSQGDQKVVNPHWTGKHCTECHTEEKNPELRFGGDVVELCNRCHLKTPPVCTKVHSQNSVLPDIMTENIPAEWPLLNSRITCLTCHAVRLQMYVNAEVKMTNKNFLRNAETEDIYSFCFNCHQEERFQKINPNR